MKYKSKLHKYVPGGAHTYSKGEDVFSENIPNILKRGDSSYVWDLDNNKYLDYGSACRSVILGYNNKKINDAAIEQIHNGNTLTKPSEIEYIAAKTIVDLIPWIDMVKFAKNGSNVTTAAIKLARAYNSKKYIITCKEQPFYSFDDWFIGRTPIKRGTLYDTNECPFLNKSKNLKFSYNNIKSLEKIFNELPNDIAAVIMEPCTYEEPKVYEDSLNFLQKVRNLCNKYNTVLIFDEMITGFRYDLKGATNLYDVEPDLITYGKAIANGFSVSVVGGKRKIMELGDIITENRERTFLMSSTHGAEMSSLGALVANIKFLKENNVIEHLKNYGKKLKKEINKISNELGILDYFYTYGYDVSPYFATKNNKKENCLKFRTLFLQEMANCNIIFPCISLTYSHGDKEMNITLKAVKKSLIIYKKALDEGIDKYLKSRVIKPVFRKYN